MISLQMSLREWAMLVSLALLWSVSYLFNKAALVDLPVLTVVAGRVVFAALMLIPLVYLFGQTLPTAARAWGVFMLLAILNNIVPFTMIATGQLWVDSGLTAILIGVTPLFSVVVSHVMTGEEPMSARRIAGVVLGIAGLTVLVGPAALRGLGTEVGGQALIVGAALSYAFAASAGRILLKGVSPLVAAAGQISCAGLVVGVAAAIVDRPWTYDPSTEAWGALFGMAFLCTVLAYLIYFSVLASAGATNILLVTLLVPIGAVIWGALIYDEAITVVMLGGMLLIFVGLATMDGRVFALLRRWRT